jgi:hypothetical protein
MFRLGLMLSLSLSLLVGLGSGRASAETAPRVLAQAGTSTPSDADVAAGANDGTKAGDAPTASAPASNPGTGKDEPEAVVAGVPMVDAALQDARPARYGVGVRSRWASTPSWMLGWFTKTAKPLSSYTVGGEFFRRSGNFDLVLGIAWQDLSPPDGNWLGSGKDPATDTDFVQFRNFGAVSVDLAFIMRTELNPWVGIHYGGGVGVGIVTGKVLRTSDGAGDCATNPGDVVGCKPQLTPPCNGPCTEQQLQNSEGGQDSSQAPSRFVAGNIPAAYPIVNIVGGLDFRIPHLDGLELKVEGGFFFPYLFLGGGVSYRI